VPDASDAANGVTAATSGGGGDAALSPAAVEAESHRLLEAFSALVVAEGAQLLGVSVELAAIVGNGLLSTDLLSGLVDRLCQARGMRCLALRGMALTTSAMRCLLRGEWGVALTDFVAVLLGGFIPPLDTVASYAGCAAVGADAAARRTLEATIHAFRTDAAVAFAKRDDDIRRIMPVALLAASHAAIQLLHAHELERGIRLGMLAAQTALPVGDPLTLEVLHRLWAEAYNEFQRLLGLEGPLGGVTAAAATAAAAAVTAAAGGGKAAGVPGASTSSTAAPLFPAAGAAAAALAASAAGVPAAVGPAADAAASPADGGDGASGDASLLTRRRDFLAAVRVLVDLFAPASAAPVHRPPQHALTAPLLAELDAAVRSPLAAVADYTVLRGEVFRYWLQAVDRAGELTPEGLRCAGAALCLHGVEVARRR